MRGFNHLIEFLNCLINNKAYEGKNVSKQNTSENCSS